MASTNSRKKGANTFRIGGTTARRTPIEKSAVIDYAALNTTIDAMQNDPSREIAEAHVRPVLEWLAAAHGGTGLDEARGLHHQLQALHALPAAAEQRRKLLDLLYEYAAKIVFAHLPDLQEITLPLARKTRRMVRALRDLLALLAQDYLDALPAAPDPQDGEPAPRSLATLQRAIRCLAWHVTISHLVAAPPEAGIWLQFHGAYRASRRLGLAKSAGGEIDSERVYLSTLLVAVAQPASFNACELDFIGRYLEVCGAAVELSEEVPSGQQGVFWIDPEKDIPAQALTRRTPTPDSTVLYFACDSVARGAAAHLAALEAGQGAAALGLPAFADTPAGRGVLRRLSQLWGQPAKRKFPRRRQSYRASLCAGLDHLWHLLRGDDNSATSEWMITNESPDGYAMMHVAGEIEQIRVGDIVAIHPHPDDPPVNNGWSVCIVRWALSENAEHIEIGLQVLAPHAIPVELAVPDGHGGGDHASALLLPQLPPLRPLPALAIRTGVVDDQARKLIILVEQGNLAVHELRVTERNEQTSSIEVFTVAPDERP